MTVGWRKLGENIGRGPSVASIHDALVHSAPHYANMVDGAFHWVGVGVAYGGGQMYVAEVFMDGDPPPRRSRAPGADGTALGGAHRVRTGVGLVGAEPPRRVRHRVATGRSPTVVRRAVVVPRLGEPRAGLPVASRARRPRRRGARTGIDVFATANDGSLRHMWWDGASWSALGEPRRAARLRAGRGVVGVGPARRVRPARPAARSCTSPGTAAGPGGSPSAAASWVTPRPCRGHSGRIDVFVRGTDNRLYHRFYSGGWSGWESLGGVLSVGSDGRRRGVRAGSTSSSAAPTTDLYHRWWDGAGWHGYESSVAP